MTISVLHNFVNPKADGGDATITRPSNWNEQHNLTMASGFVLGNFSGSNGPVLEVIVREVLIATRNYYVRTDGSDSNTGLVNNAGGAFLTIQHAYNIVAGLDLNGNTVNINIADGTYTAGLSITSSWIGGGVVALIGNTSTPSNVFFNLVSGDCINVALGISLSGTLQYGGFKFVTANGSAISHSGIGLIFQSSACEYGACSNYHLSAQAPGAVLQAFGSRTISGNATVHLLASTGGLVYADFLGTQTIVGSLTFTYFAWATRSGTVISNSAAYSGTAPTAIRYNIDTGGNIYTGSGGANYFPGSSPGLGGTTAGGGYYA